jgi:malonyl-CoA O-methyltransferase
MMQVARTRLQRNFSRAAEGYDAQAQFQHVQTRRVLDAALMLLPARARMVDIGCGTGYFAQMARGHRPHWAVVGVDIAQGMCQAASMRCDVLQADAAQLPFADSTLDAAVSSLCLQWVEDKARAFGEIARVLKPGGQAIIATLGTDSLQELRAAAVQVVLPLGLLPMVRAEDYRAAIASAGLAVTLFEQSCDVEHYATVGALLDSMRGIGAGNSFGDAPRGMTGAGRYRAMLAAYEKSRDPKGLPATWERLFMVLRKPL